MRLILSLLFLIESLIGGQLNIEVRARSAILMNAETGAILFEKHPHLPVHPASTTKIGTALYILDNQVDLNRFATVTREALRGRPVQGRDQHPPYWLDSDGTMMGLKVGETLPFDALLHGLMKVSGNDAANVLAETIGGTVPQFVDAMNEYLQRIGCKNTRFRNPHGLTHPEHLSTAYDLALMTRKALKIPKFREVVTTLNYKKGATNKQPASEIPLLNPLMKPNSRYYYPKAIGVKTGYTEAAQFNLVTAAEHEGRILIGVLLGCENKGHRYEDVKKMFETAFAEERATRRLMGPENIFTKEIVGAKTPLKACVLKPLVISYFPSEEPHCKAALHWDADKLPIRKGQKVGEVHICNQEGVFIQKGDLLAVEEVKATFLASLKEWLKRFSPS